MQKIWYISRKEKILKDNKTKIQFYDKSGEIKHKGKMEFKII